MVAAARGCINAAGVGTDLVVIELGDGLLGAYGVMDVLRDASIRSATVAVVLAAPDPVAAWGGAQLDAEGLPGAMALLPGRENGVAASAASFPGGGGGGGVGP